VTNTYGYDQAGRLTSWTATPAGGTPATQTYGYDNNGNLTNDNGTTHTYDTRNELTSDGTSSYSYTANGDLASKTGPSGTTSYTTDAYGQQITDGPSSYAWDALDRLVGAGSQSGGSGTAALTYDGMTNEVASDPSATYSRDPSGRLVGVNSVAGGPTLALIDEHGDLSGTFTAAGSAMTSSTTYSPWGSVLATSGPAPEVGYQGQWTDPATGQTDMGARFYAPGNGGFLNADTSPAASGPASGDNGYAYANDNPMSVTDPSGHSPSEGSGGGNVTQADVNAAKARADQTAQIAAQAQAAAANAAAVAAHAASTAAAAHREAQELNSDASRVLAQANSMSAKAQALYNQAQAALSVANYWLGRANALRNYIQALWNDSPWWCLPCKAVAKGVALLDGPLVNAYMANYRAAETVYENDMEESGQIQVEADTLYQNYALLHAQAVAAGDQAAADSRLAAEDAGIARHLAQVAAADQQIANQAEAYYRQLEKEYEAEQHRAKSTKKHHKDAKPKGGCHGLLSCVAHCIDHAASCVTHTVTHAATTAVTSTVHAAVSCVTKLNAGACVQTAVTVVLVLGTGPEGEAAEAAIEAALEAEGEAATAEAGWGSAGGLDPSKILFRFGNGPETTEGLIADAQRAVDNNFPWGISTMSKLPPRFLASGEYRSTTVRQIIEQGYNVIKTGKNPYHYTVQLPNPITPGVTGTVNAIFGSGG
jgi:RHS repeat-associated protein